MGTVYCLHHEEENLLGSDPVPCPFCGFGAERQPAKKAETEARGIQDSTAALKHALDEASGSDQPQRDSTLRGYW